MPRRWSNRQTELIATWLGERPELVAVIRRTAETGDDEAFREHVADYFFPLNIDRDVYCELVQLALEVADWDQIKAAIQAPADGFSS